VDFKPYKIGKYLLLEKLATGGMAEVYRAKASGAGGFEKQLAIKRILPSYSANDEFRRMFEYEARLSSMLTHSNIVQIYDFVKSGETYLLAMEYVDGKNLRQLVNKAKKAGIQLPVEFGVYIMNETCKGLEYAHKKKDDLNGRPLNIIHRDMSPQNIMISYDGAVKIVDFGIAKAKDRVDETRSGVIKGKFGYMSPEQANGESVDHRTDIFSTGIILWEMLTGKRLFAAENDMATLKQIQECVIPSASRLNPKVTPELEKIILKGLTKDLRLRYNDAGLFHRNLQEFLNKYYPTFTQKEAGDIISRVFKEEITQEKKRFEQIYRQSIPFSQGANKEEESGGSTDDSGDGVEEALEGSMTRSEVGSKSSITFVSQIGEPGIPNEIDPDADAVARPEDATNAGVSQSKSIKSTIGEPIVIDADEISGSKGLRRDTGLSGLVIPNKVTENTGKAERTKVTGDEELFRDDNMPVLNNTPTPTPTRGGSVSRSGITLAKNSKTGGTQSQGIQLNETDPSTNPRRRDRSISAVTQMGKSGGKEGNTSSREVTLMPVGDSPTVRSTTRGVARAEGTGSYHRLEGNFPEREEYLPARRRRHPILRLLVFFMMISGVAYLYQTYMGGVPTEWIRMLAGIKAPSGQGKKAVPSDPEKGKVESETPMPVERRPGGDCNLRVESVPAGARVFVNGEEAGVTLANLPLPCNQSINLTLKLDGYESMSENLMIQTRTEKVTKSLKKVPTGRLELTLNQNATVIVDGVEVGSAERGQKFEVLLRANQEHRVVLENKVYNLRIERKYTLSPDTVKREVLSLDEVARKR